MGGVGVTHLDIFKFLLQNFAIGKRYKYDNVDMTIDSEFIEKFILYIYGLMNEININLIERKNKNIIDFITEIKKKNKVDFKINIDENINENDKKNIQISVAYNVYNKIKNNLSIGTKLINFISKKTGGEDLLSEINKKFENAKEEKKKIKKIEKIKDNKIEQIISNLSTYLIYIFNINTDLEILNTNILNNLPFDKDKEIRTTLTILSNKIKRINLSVMFILDIILDNDDINNTFNNEDKAFAYFTKNLKKPNIGIENIYIIDFLEAKLKAEKEAEAKSEGEKKAKEEEKKAKEAERKARKAERGERESDEIVKARVTANVKDNITNNVLIIFIGNEFIQKIQTYYNANIYLRENELIDIVEKKYYNGKFYIIIGDSKNKILDIIVKHLIDKQNITDYLSNDIIKKDGKEYKFIQIFDIVLLLDILNSF